MKINFTFDDIVNECAMRNIEMSISAIQHALSAGPIPSRLKEVCVGLAQGKGRFVCLGIKPYIRESGEKSVEAESVKARQARYEKLIICHFEGGAALSVHQVHDLVGTLRTIDTTRIILARMVEGGLLRKIQTMRRGSVAYVLTGSAA